MANHRGLETFEFGSGRALSVVAILLGALAIAQPARADGPLQPGEILVNQYGDVVRFQPDAPFDSEIITTLGGGGVAIADRNHVYVVEMDPLTPGHGPGHIWKVDVVSLVEELVTTVAGAQDIAVEPDGSIVLLVPDSGQVVRVDDPLGPEQATEILVTDPRILDAIPGAALKVAAKGDIFMTNYEATWRIEGVENGTMTRVWPDAPLYQGFGRSLDIDRATGDLIVAAGFAPIDLVRMDPSDPDAYLTPTLVYSGLTVMYTSIALEASGNILMNQPNGRINVNVDPIEFTPIPFYAGDIEVVRPECSNGLDDDHDGKADFRLDGSGDPQCTDSNDDSEAPPRPPTCAVGALASANDTLHFGFVALFGLFVITRRRNRGER